MSTESKYAPLVALTLSASLLGGCASSEHFNPPDTHKQDSDLLFDDAPESNFRVSSCNTQPNGWVVYVDANPADIDSSDQTVGFTEGYSEDGHPNAVHGAKIRSLGGLAYEIATSDDRSGESKVVNLGNERYSTILDGGDGYDIVLTGRLGDDGAAYFGANCLPDANFPYDNESPHQEAPAENIEI